MMVELTYQMVLSTIQTLSLVLGISYYIIVLRNQQKSQKHVEDTRKIQLLHDISEFTSSSNNDFNTMMEMEWTDYTDFENKYGWKNNFEVYNSRVKIWRNMNYYGILVQDGIIDVSTYVRMISDEAPVVWDKFKEIILELRRIQDNPDLYRGMETLAEETDNYRIRKGLKPKGN